MELTDLLVPEECVRHPDLADVREGQVFDLLCNEEVSQWDAMSTYSVLTFQMTF